MLESKAFYTDGLSAKRVQCSVTLIENSLKLAFNNDGFTFLVWDISAINNVQWNGEILNITYGQYPHQSLQLDGAMASAVAEKWANRNVFRKTQHLGNKKIGLVLIGLIVLFIGLVGTVWFFVLPWVAERAANYIPPDVEASMGESLAKTYQQGYKTSDSANYYLADFAKQINFNSPYQIQPEVLVSDEINAFALPGGKIFVFSQIILKMDNYRQLVALLGHEASHVNKRHSLKSICRQAAGSIAVATIFGDATEISAGLLSQANQLQQLNYSRELETEADNEGLKIMIANSVDGQGMLQLLKLLQKENTEVPAMMKYLSTHPDTEARIKQVEEQLKEKSNSHPNQALERTFLNLQRVLKNDNQ